MGGNSRTLIILCITPALSQIEQSLSTMRFGVQAKKIENKVQANVITAVNENETIKLLIEDYEKKLKELEKERLEDKEKIKNLTGEFKGKTVNFHKEAMRNEDYNSEFLEKTGLIFLPKNSQKKQKEIRKFLTKKLKDNWQELIFDFEGKIALEGYKRLKEVQALFLSNQRQYEENFEEIMKDFLELEEKFITIEQKKIGYKSKAKGLVSQLILAKKESLVLKSRFNLLESFIGLGKLSNKEVLALEEHFSKGLVHCQNERLSRVTRKTMNKSYEDESPRKENRPMKNNEELVEFSEDDEKIGTFDSFEEIEKKIENQEENKKKKLKFEKNRLKEVFTQKIEKISNKITVKNEDLKKFELIYLDLLMKRTKEERLSFISKNELFAKSTETKDFFIKTKENTKKPKGKPQKPLEISSSSITEEDFKKTSLLMKLQPQKQRFRSLDEREIEKLKIHTQKKRITQEKTRNNRKDFIEINKKSLGFKVTLSKAFLDQKPENTTNSSDFKAQKALDRGNHFLKEKIEVKSAQIPPKTPNFEQSRQNKIFQQNFSTEEKSKKLSILSTEEEERKKLSNGPKNAIMAIKDQDNFSIEEERKKLMNNPKNTLMALLSNLNSVNSSSTQKKAEFSKESGFTKANISESCAFKISNYKSILDKETMRVIEEKKRKIMGEKDKLASEPNESGIEKNVETESFFSNCVNGFEYLLIGDINEKVTVKQLDEIVFEGDSVIRKNSGNDKKESSSVFKKKKK